MLLLEYLQADRTAFLAFCTLAGLMVGSFLNVVIYRLPTMMQQAWRAECTALLDLPSAAGEGSPAEPISLLSPRSRCRSCHRPIRAIENIPVLSYLVLRGRCAGCGQRISIRYPLIELLSAGLSFTVAWHFGFGWAALASLLFLWACIALCFIDLDHQLLPDAITLPLLWLGLAVNYFEVFCPLPDAVLGAIFGYGILWIVFHGFRLLTGKEGMGYGDFKLLAMLGAWQGWQSLPAIILISSIAGAVIGIALIILQGRDRAAPMPFGPYLTIAGVLCLLFGENINAAYLGLGRG